MNTVRRLLYKEIALSVAFVAIGFLALFFFFDLLDELNAMGRLGAQGYRMAHALLVVTSKVPGHLYDLMPIAVLIGSIYVMARLAQSSEFTILRAGGMGPGRALRLLWVLGAGFTLLTWALGDYVSPWSEQQGTLLKARFRGDLSAGQTGAWLKEKQGPTHYAINVRALDANADMKGVHIQQFNANLQLQGSLTAASASFGEGEWLLRDVKRMEIARSTGTAQLRHTHSDTLAWPTTLTQDMVGAVLLSAERMKIWDLTQYIQHLQRNNQNAQPYAIQLWRKVFYPLSCLVMLTLALPFAYLHFRSGQIATHVFGGVMAGISFYLLNNVFSHVGTLNDWEPWLTSAAPSLIYTAISLGAIRWMVYR